MSASIVDVDVDVDAAPGVEEARSVSCIATPITTLLSTPPGVPGAGAAADIA